jgi:uncharacterized protein YdhG (YjbR/CyaY superfamily)
MTSTTTNLTQKSNRFTLDERIALKERAKERKAETRRGTERAEGEAVVRAKIAEMPAADRTMAERLHALIQASAPSLSPKTWYGMPAYAKDGKVVCFFQSASKFSTRYATLGFTHEANLDNGGVWPTAFALATLTASHEVVIAALVKRAASTS